MVKDTMELEGLLLLTCKCCKGENTELAAINLRTPMTDCHERMLDDLRRQAPESLRCHGLMMSRVVAKGGDGGEMYFISPVKVDRWKAFIDALAYIGYDVRGRGGVRRRAMELSNNLMKTYGWEEPMQLPPTRMCDVD